MIRAGEFFAGLQRIKTHLGATPGASDELKASFSRLMEGFRRAYTPEAFKTALKGDDLVPSDVEDRLASALILLNRERAGGAASSDAS